MYEDTGHTVSKAACYASSSSFLRTSSIYLATRDNLTQEYVTLEADGGTRILDKALSWEESARCWTRKYSRVAHRTLIRVTNIAPVSKFLVKKAWQGAACTKISRNYLTKISSGLYWTAMALPWYWSCCTLFLEQIVDPWERYGMREQYVFIDT